MESKINFLNILPEIGMEVIVTGKISTYAKSISTYSVNIDKLELAGEGALLKLIEERKKKLEKKGIFEDKHKKKIPYLPRKIGVITSSSGSVIHDIINRIKDRFPTDIDIWPVAVQGVNASEDIIMAIEGFNKINDGSQPDIIIIARGGGSAEDLMPFNEEKLAITVFNSFIPIISAIGHETDTTIIDYVSDVRASTPTAAAEKAVPMKSELEKILSSLSTRNNNIFENRIKNINVKLISLSKFLKAPDPIIDIFRQKFNLLTNGIHKELENIYKKNTNKYSNLVNFIRSPDNLIKTKKSNLEISIKNLNRIIFYENKTKAKELNHYIRLLESNSLNSALKKGYSIVTKSQKIIKNSNLINLNDSINIQFLDKKISIKIKKIS